MIFRVYNRKTTAVVAHSINATATPMTTVARDSGENREASLLGSISMKIVSAVPGGPSIEMRRCGFLFNIQRREAMEPASRVMLVFIYLESCWLPAETCLFDMASLAIYFALVRPGRHHPSSRATRSMFVLVHACEQAVVNDLSSRLGLVTHSHARIVPRVASSRWNAEQQRWG